MDSMSSRHCSRSFASKRKSVARLAIISSNLDLQSAEKSGLSRLSSRHCLAFPMPGLTSAQNFFLSALQTRKRTVLRRRSPASSTSLRKSSSWQSQERETRFLRRHSWVRPSPGCTPSHSTFASSSHSSWSIASSPKSLEDSNLVRKISVLQPSLSFSSTSLRQVTTAPGSGYRVASSQNFAASALQEVASTTSKLTLVALSILKLRTSSLHSPVILRPSTLPFSSKSFWVVKHFARRPSPGLTSAQKWVMSLAHRPVVSRSPSPLCSSTSSAASTMCETTGSSSSRPSACACSLSSSCA
mmetsp:Transcript_35361/g.59589  ORF Transcript_35361/g.59589 Transcript_35361/m.59589 type:complete len:300 (+) Transcript_35361:1971-2870(+)